MRSYVIIKESEDKETALSIPHIQSIAKDGEGCIVYYLNPYVNEETNFRFDVSVQTVVDAIHETLGKLERQDEGGKNTCPVCGHPIKIGKSRTGCYFIGCSTYPQCNWCTPIEAWMKADGDPEKWKKQRGFKKY